MLTGIDHVIVAVHDPDTAAAELQAGVGLRSGGGGRHEAHGTYNRLIWLGDSYVELMGLFDAKLAADSWWGSHLLRLLSAHGPGLAGVVFASSDLAADVELLRTRGAPLSDPVAGERVRPDGEVVRWRIGRLQEADPDLGLTFLIEHDATSAEWRAADRAARVAEQHPLGTAVGLTRVVVPAADVARATMRLLRDFGLQFRPSLAGGGARDASIGGQTLRLLPSRAAAPLPVIGLRGGAAARSVELLGVRWELSPV